MQNKKILPWFPGKLGIFVIIRKNLIRMKWNPHYSELETSKTLIEIEFHKMQNKKILP